MLTKGAICIHFWKLVCQVHNNHRKLDDRQSIYHIYPCIGDGQGIHHHFDSDPQLLHMDFVKNNKYNVFGHYIQ